MTTNRVRILYVTDGISPWVVGGMQSVARRHICWLTEAGYEVVAVTSGAYMPDNAGIASRIITLPWPQRSLISKLSPWNYSRQLSAFSKAVAELVNDITPDLIYSEGPLMDAYFARDVDARVPVIFHPHGLEMFQDTGSPLVNARTLPLRSLIRRHAAHADVTISQGGHLDNILAGPVGATKERISYLPNCTPEGFRFAETGRRRRTGRFLFIGRNEVRKGLPQLLTAITKTRGCYLDVVGDTGRSIKTQDNVKFHGPVTDRELLRAFFDDADFLVVPSHAEGMPTVILEAFSAAVPVIATDVGAVAALVRDGDTGLLVPRSDPSALVTALQTAASMDTVEWQQRSARALAIARTSFSPDRIRAILFGIIESTIAQRNTPDARKKFLLQ